MSEIPNRKGATYVVNFNFRNKDSSESVKTKTIRSANLSTEIPVLDAGLSRWLEWILPASLSSTVCVWMKTRQRESWRTKIKFGIFERNCRVAWTLVKAVMVPIEVTIVNEQENTSLHRCGFTSCHELDGKESGCFLWTTTTESTGNDMPNFPGPFTCF